MALSTNAHDLRALIRSSHLLVVIETVEEERVLALLQSVAAQEHMPLDELRQTAEDRFVEPRGFTAVASS